MNIRMRRISLDLHKDGPAPDNVMTEYEGKFFDQGMPIYRLEALIGKDALAEHIESLAKEEQ
jgi:tRNA (guanine-N7-)-methyltransferase